MISINCVKKYCKDDISLIENYEKAINDKTQKWHCHHKLEIGEGYRNTVNDLKLMGLYYDRPAGELIFLTNAEHTKLHGNISRFNKSEKHLTDLKYNNPMFRDEIKKKISIQQKGKNNSNYGAKSEFGIKFLEHYNITKCSNPILYARERSYWKTHNKCRWEE